MPFSISYTILLCQLTVLLLLVAVQTSVEKKNGDEESDHEANVVVGIAEIANGGEVNATFGEETWNDVETTWNEPEESGNGAEVNGTVDEETWNDVEENWNGVEVTWNEPEESGNGAEVIWNDVEGTWTEHEETWNEGVENAG